MYLITDKKQPIKEVQRILLALGYGESHLVPIDGIYGENTRSAVVDFQKRKNLPQTGSVNYETHLALLLAYMLLSQEETKGGLFPLKIGMKGELIRIMHSYINILESENKAQHIPLVENVFGERSEIYVNQFLRRVGEEENGMLRYDQFLRMGREAMISLENNF